MAWQKTAESKAHGRRKTSLTAVPRTRKDNMSKIITCDVSSTYMKASWRTFTRSTTITSYFRGKAAIALWFAASNRNRSNQERPGLIPNSRIWSSLSWVTFPPRRTSLETILNMPLRRGRAMSHISSSGLSQLTWMIDWWPTSTMSIFWGWRCISIDAGSKANTPPCRPTFCRTDTMRQYLITTPNTNFQDRCGGIVTVAMVTTWNLTDKSYVS